MCRSKPFAVPNGKSQEPGAVDNFNFNVSHEAILTRHNFVDIVFRVSMVNTFQTNQSVWKGDYVVLAAEMLCLVGVDISTSERFKNSRIQSGSLTTLLQT